jgi:hypothetical protein
MITVLSTPSKDLFDIRPSFSSYELEHMMVDSGMSSSTQDTVIIFNKDRTMITFMSDSHGSCIKMLIGDDLNCTYDHTEEEIQKYAELLKKLTLMFQEMYNKMTGNNSGFFEPNHDPCFYETLRIMDKYNIWYDLESKNSFCSLLYATTLGTNVKDIQSINMICKKTHELYRMFLHRDPMVRKTMLNKFTM